MVSTIPGKEKTVFKTTQMIKNSYRVLAEMPVYSFEYFSEDGLGKEMISQAFWLGLSALPAAFAAAVVVGPITGLFVLAALAGASACRLATFLDWCWGETLEHRRREARRVEARRIERILLERRIEREIEERWGRENAAMAPMAA